MCRCWLDWMDVLVLVRLDVNVYMLVIMDEC